MTDVERQVTVVRRATEPSRELRHGRGRVFDLVGPAEGSTLDIHVNELRPGAGAGPYHLHTKAENVFLVFEGQVRLRIEGTDHLLSPGDAAFVPPNVPHSVSAVDDAAVRVLEIYAPAAPDFVPVEEGGAN